MQFYSVRFFRFFSMCFIGKEIGKAQCHCVGVFEFCAAKSHDRIGDLVIW